MRRGAVCACCRRQKADATPRAPRTVDPTQRLLCDACWKDPALAYTACLHGLPGAGDAVWHPEYGTGTVLRYEPERGVCVQYPRQPTLADGIYHHPSAFSKGVSGPSGAGWRVAP